MLDSSSNNICINGYEILESKGNGNIGSVFQAKKDKKLYAIKMVNKNSLENMDNFYNLMQKMEKLENGGNNNVIKIHEFFQNPLHIFIVMENCNQGNLLQYMLNQPEKRLDCFKAIELFAQILNGFQFLHSNNIQHRNLKPQNILMHNDKPKITDYGVYMLYNGQENKYQMREFMSPENYELQSDQVSHLCDIWGLGILLFFMIFNTWPFKDFEDIRKYTFNKQFDLEQFLKEKDIAKPLTLQQNSQIMTMLSDIFQGLFVYESKNRMSFQNLWKHQIFLKVKNFDMGESILFYFHYEKNFQAAAHSPTFKQTGGAANITGLPGVSARSMYSGDVLDDLKSNENNSIMISTPTLQVKKVHSKKCSLSNENQENLEMLNQDQSKILLNYQPMFQQQNFFKIPQISSQNQINISNILDLIQDSPIANKLSKKKNNNEDNLFIQNEGGVMLSSFGKKRLEDLKQVNSKQGSLSPLNKYPQKFLLESEPDFENTEEFDSVHKEPNIIPQFCTLKACKMVNFQFKPHQDSNAMNMLDSYSLSSVISIPRPFSEGDTIKRQISSLYDLEIYRYRFIEQTIHILKNTDKINQTPIIDYQLLIKTEYYCLKNAFYIAKTLLQKVERKENFLKIDPRDFTKYFTQQCYDKYTEILEKDLQRLYAQYYLSQTQLQNQGISQKVGPTEIRYFFFKRNSANLLQEENSIDESDVNTRKGNILKQQQKQMSQQSTNNVTQQNNTQQTNFHRQLQETPSFTNSKNSPSFIPQQNQSRLALQNESAYFPISELNQYINEETESLKGETQLDEKHIKELQEKYTENLKKVFSKLKIQYEKAGTSSDDSLKIVKLALRIAMCLRHEEIFDKNQMEQFLIYFKAEHSNQQISGPQLNIMPNNINIGGGLNTLQISIANQMINSHHKISSPSLGTSMTNSKNKKQTNSSQLQFSIESLVKWVNHCSRSEALRQIQVLVIE